LSQKYDKYEKFGSIKVGRKSPKTKVRKKNNSVAIQNGRGIQ